MSGRVFPTTIASSPALPDALLPLPLSMLLSDVLCQINVGVSVVTVELLVGIESEKVSGA